jgi:hypothetical protein
MAVMSKFRNFVSKNHLYIVVVQILLMIFYLLNKFSIHFLLITVIYECFPKNDRTKPKPKKKTTPLIYSLQKILW